MKWWRVERDVAYQALLPLFLRATLKSWESGPGDEASTNGRRNLLSNIEPFFEGGVWERSANARRALGPEECSVNYIYAALWELSDSCFMSNLGTVSNHLDLHRCTRAKVWRCRYFVRPWRAKQLRWKWRRLIQLKMLRQKFKIRKESLPINKGLFSLESSWKIKGRWLITIYKRSQQSIWCWDFVVSQSIHTWLNFCPGESIHTRLYYTLLGYANLIHFFSSTSFRIWSGDHWFHCWARYCMCRTTPTWQ